MTRRPVAPTEAGARLLEHAEPILLRLDAARADVARVAAGPPRELRIGATPLAAAFAAELVAPALAVTVRVGARDEIARAVAVGELDAGVVDGVAAPNDPLRLPETGAPRRSLHEEPLAVAVAARPPARRATAIRMEELVDARWIDAPGDLRAARRTRRARARRRVPAPRSTTTGGRRRAARARRRRARPRAAARRALGGVAALPR